MANAVLKRCSSTATAGCARRTSASLLDMPINPHPNVAKSATLGWGTHDSYDPRLV